MTGIKDDLWSHDWLTSQLRGQSQECPWPWRTDTCLSDYLTSRYREHQRADLRSDLNIVPTLKCIWSAIIHFVQGNKLAAGMLFFYTTGASDWWTGADSRGCDPWPRGFIHWGGGGRGEIGPVPNIWVFKVLLPWIKIDYRIFKEDEYLKSDFSQWRHVVKDKVLSCKTEWTEWSNLIFSVIKAPIIKGSSCGGHKTGADCFYTTRTQYSFVQTRK